MTPETRIGIEATLSHMEAYSSDIVIFCPVDAVKEYARSMRQSAKAIRTLLSEPEPVNESILDVSSMD